MMEETLDILEMPSVQVVQMGSTEVQSYTEWADYTIQDWSVALEIAQEMLEGDGTYEFVDDFPQEFEIVDRAAFEAQVADAQKELENES